MKVLVIILFFIPIHLVGQNTNETPSDTTVTDSLVFIPEMTVVAKRNTLKRKIDRLEFTVEGTPLQNLNGWDILSRTPNVLVRNESISVRGNNQIIVTINDRKTLMSQEELRQFLENTSGSDIYSIEVITNPPAKYEAEGGAVINIKMKQNKLTGYRGNISCRYHQSIYAKGRVGLTQSYNTKKWQLSGSYTIVSGDYVRYNSDVVTYDQSKTRWESNMVRKTESHQQHLFGFSSQYEIDTLSSLRFGVDGMVNPKSTGRYYIPTNIYNTETNLLESYYLTANNRFQKYNTLNAYLAYDKKFKNVTISWSNNFSNKNYMEEQDISTWQYFKGLPASFNRFGNSSNQNIKLFSSQFDYKWEKGDLTLESGAKYSLVQNDNQLDFLNDSNGNLIKDELRSNHFYYNEQIIAAYLSAEYKLGKWFFKAGLRNETTLIHTTSDNPVVTNQTNRNNLFPTFYSLYELSDDQQIGFSYGRRIDRPVYDFLNPSRSYYNYYSYFQGDPYLKSTLMDNLSLTYTFKDWNFEVSYSYLKHPSMEILFQNSTTFETIYQFTNIKNARNLSFNFFKSFTLLSNWKLDFFGMGQYMENNFMGIDQQQYRNNVFFYHLNISTQLALDKAKTWNMNVGYHFNSKAVQGPFDISSSQNTYFVISKRLLDRKLEIGLVFNDIFRTDKNTITTRYADQNQSFKDYRDTQSLMINLKYNFGNQKVKEAKSADKTDEQKRL